VKTSQRSELTAEGRLEVCGGWARLVPPEGLGKYLRHLFHLWTHRVHKLQAPSRGAHITVAEPGRASPGLLALVGREFEFTLGLDPRTNGNAWWLPCGCEALEPHRATPTDFHLCLGYEREGSHARHPRPD
jgi:hypothetical protein